MWAYIQKLLAVAAHCTWKITAGRWNPAWICPFIPRFFPFNVPTSGPAAHLVRAALAGRRGSQNVRVLLPSSASPTAFGTSTSTFTSRKKALGG